MEAKKSESAAAAAAMRNRLCVRLDYCTYKVSVCTEDRNKLKKVNKNHHTIANKTLTRKSIIIFCVRLNPFRRQSYFSASLFWWLYCCCCWYCCCHCCCCFCCYCNADAIAVLHSCYSSGCWLKFFSFFSHFCSRAHTRLCVLLFFSSFRLSLSLCVLVGCVFFFLLSHFVYAEFFFCAHFVISVRRIVASPATHHHRHRDHRHHRNQCVCVFSRQLTSATRYAQSHTDRKREIGESVNRITVHCASWFACTILVFFIYLFFFIRVAFAAFFFFFFFIEICTFCCCWLLSM